MILCDISNIYEIAELSWSTLVTSLEGHTVLPLLRCHLIWTWIHRRSIVQMLATLLVVSLPIWLISQIQYRTKLCLHTQYFWWKGIISRHIYPYVSLLIATVAKWLQWHEWGDCLTSVRFSTHFSCYFLYLCYCK